MAPGMRPRTGSSNGSSSQFQSQASVSAAMFRPFFTSFLLRFFTPGSTSGHGGAWDASTPSSSDGSSRRSCSDSPHKFESQASMALGMRQKPHGKIPFVGALGGTTGRGGRNGSSTVSPKNGRKANDTPGRANTPIAVPVPVGLSGGGCGRAVARHAPLRTPCPLISAPKQMGHRLMVHKSMIIQYLRMNDANMLSS